MIMKNVISGYEPASLFRYFEEICAIPHGSGNEAALASYIESFAAEHQLYCLHDEHHNVFIRREAIGKGREKPPVMLQGHLDMVCEKDAEVAHDFMRDPLKLRVQDGWLTATGTTLGADDGVAVAMMLQALSEEPDETMPTLECLFTVSEETGMDGARCFDYSVVRSERIINLDSEAEGVVWISCAGGIDLDVTYEYETQKCSVSILSLTVGGLAGGHSGTDIANGRANANLLLGRLLSALYENEPFHLISISSTGKRNAIPRECRATIAVSDPTAAVALLRKESDVIARELSESDRKYALHIQKGKAGEIPDCMLTFHSTSRILTFMRTVPNGVQTLCPSDLTLVESSANFATIEMRDQEVHFGFMNRSSVESVMDDMIARFTLLARAVDMKVTASGRYPGWAYVSDTPLQRDYLRLYREISGREGKAAAIHAGLECGLLLSHLPGSDAISIGPNMRDIHSPREALDLASTERCYRLVQALLRA